MKRWGFTIVELLVVISIIGLLSAVGFLSFSSQQRRAREARRIADIGTISDALQQYVALGNDIPSTRGDIVATTNAVLQPLVSAGLIAKVPVEQYPVSTSLYCSNYLYMAPASQIAAKTGPDGAVGLRQYALSFPSEVMTATNTTHPMNSAIANLNPALDGGNCTNGWLLGSK